MLTHKQKDLLLLLRERIAEQGVPPSFEEMKDALGLRSKSGIHRLIAALEERGYVRRLPHRARALEVLKLPEGLGGAVAAIPAPGVLPSRRSAPPPGPFLRLPLCGRIAAGTPIEALAPGPSEVEVPASLLGRSRGTAGHYVLEVAGDSMIGAGIMDGDRVVIRRADTAENGAIVVALVDEVEATLKYLERREGAVALVPANPAYETRLYEPGRVRVQGQLAALLRSYA